MPQNWQWTNFQRIIQDIKYGYTAKSQNNGNIKFLRITDIKDGFVNFNTVPYCDISETNYNNYKIMNGDILIARSGSVGKSFIAKNIDEAIVYASYLIRIRLIDMNLLPFIELYLSSPLYWNQLYDTSFGNVLKNVNSKSLKSLNIPIPPLNEQSKIINIVEQVIQLL